MQCQALIPLRRQSCMCRDRLQPGTLMRLFHLPALERVHLAGIQEAYATSQAFAAAIAALAAAMPNCTFVWSSNDAAEDWSSDHHSDRYATGA